MESIKVPAIHKNHDSILTETFISRDRLAIFTIKLIKYSPKGMPSRIPAAVIQIFWVCSKERILLVLNPRTLRMDTSLVFSVSEITPIL
jgi:hypothetical protein